MAVYVLKKWQVSPSPDEAGNYCEILGRSPGLISWFLALLGIERSVSFVVSESDITYGAGSWSGVEKRIIPIRQVSSMSYGFARPWRECVSFLFFSLMCIIGLCGSGAISVGVALLLELAAIVCCLIYYALNKRLSLAVQEVGSITSKIQFKRSVIEGKKLDEEDASLVCDIIQALMAND